MQAILSKMLAIMTDVDRIEKDGTNDFHKYKYASEKIIKERLHTALVKHKVVFYVTKAEQSVTDVVTTSTDAKGNAKEKVEHLTSAILTYRFCDVESGEYLEGQGIGQGQDPGDKGSYKAITGALKYILTTSFLIPTGDDPEADTETDKATAKAPAKPTAPKKPESVPAGGHEFDERTALMGRIAVQKARQGAKDLKPESWDSLLVKAFDTADRAAIKEMSPMNLKAGIDKLAALIDEIEQGAQAA